MTGLYSLIYSKTRAKSTAKEAAKEVLQVMTNGLYITWNPGRVNLELLAIIKKFERS